MREERSSLSHAGGTAHTEAAQSDGAEPYTQIVTVAVDSAGGLATPDEDVPIEVATSDDPVTHDTLSAAYYRGSGVPPQRELHLGDHPSMHDEIHANDSLALAEDDTVGDKDLNIAPCEETIRLVGDKGSKLHDDHITASSYWRNDAGHGANEMWRSRLDNRHTTWCAGARKVDEYIQWDFGDLYTVSHVMTKGRVNSAQWVTEYALKYSLEGSKWTTAGTFTGNSDKDTLRENKLENPIKARFVRLYVKKWRSYPSMRADFKGCKWSPTTTTTTTTTSTTTTPQVKAGTLGPYMHPAVLATLALGWLLQLGSRTR
jgi:hypothetical protein